MTETTSSTNPNQEIIQSLLKAKSQEIIAVSTIHQHLAKLYPVIATLDSSSMDFENPTETPPLTSSTPLPATIPETKPKDEIVAANSSTDAHGDIWALLQPMLDTGVIKLAEKQKIIYINLRTEEPFGKPLTEAEYNALPDEDKVFCFPIIDVDINIEHKTPYIFLGDALDRGEFSINCLLQIIYILRKQQDLMKEGKLTKKIFTALLGNHEIAYLFKKYELIFHESFVAKLPGFIEQEIISKEELKKILENNLPEILKDGLTVNKEYYIKQFLNFNYETICDHISNSILELLKLYKNKEDLSVKNIKKIILKKFGKFFENYPGYANFTTQLADYISQKVCIENQNKIEYIDTISDLMWRNIDLFDFCKAIKIKVGTTYVYSHANLPLEKIEEFLPKTENLDMDINDIILENKMDIDWSELNKLFKAALKQYQNNEGLLKIPNDSASKSELEEEQRALYCILSSFCSTRPEECVADYYKSPNIINITGHTIRVEITCENLLYILTDTGSSYWFRLNCPNLNTMSSSTSLTQSGNVYMNFYDELSLKQNADGKYLVEIIPNTAEKKLIYLALPITKINTSSEVAKILTPDYYFDFFERTEINGFNVMRCFSELKTYFETLSTYKNEDKVKHIAKIRGIIPTILQKALTKIEIEEFREEFNKKYPYNLAEVCKYFSDQCSNKCLTLNLDDIKKYCNTMFELLNDDGSYKEELTYVCPEHVYKSSEVFNTLLNTINVSLSITTEIEGSYKEQLQEIFRLNIDNQELKKQAKNKFQQFLKDLEKEKQTSQQTTIFS